MDYEEYKEALQKAKVLLQDANNIIVITNNKNYQGTSFNPTSVPEDLSYTKGYRDGYVQGQRLLQERYFELVFECNRYAFKSQKFFIKELWRKVSGFENCYKSFVENAFSWYWMKQDMISKGKSSQRKWRILLIEISIIITMSCSISMKHGKRMKIKNRKVFEIKLESFSEKYFRKYFGSFLKNMYLCN